MRVPKRKSEQRRQIDNDNYLSPGRIHELRQELVKLRQHVRPKAVEELTRTREMGDLSENAAYSHAKGRLIGIDRRIFEIEEKIKNAIPINPNAGDSGFVCIGAVVTVEVNGECKTFEITGSQETDPSSGKISHRSPVGSSLLGHRVGETVTIGEGDRRRNYLIVTIK